ncbi:MAG: hypothetical protein ACJA06_001696 [Halocynthiibacter sp.]|jgi:hypothetical protein
MISLRRSARFLWLMVPLALAACGAAEPKWAPDAEVARAVYVAPGGPTLTLFTVINNYNGSGAHSGLMVNAEQRVIFDPAGTFQHPHLPERNDVIFGMSPPAVEFYIDYHARETYRVIENTIPVSHEVAALAMRKVQSYGAVPKAQCANSITDILNDLPGFESVPNTMFPKQLRAAFVALPNVSERTVRDDSPDDNSGMIQAPVLWRR